MAAHWNHLSLIAVLSAVAASSVVSGRMCGPPGTGRKKRLAMKRIPLSVSAR
jgi:hypothetical protein